MARSGRSLQASETRATEGAAWAPRPSTALSAVVVALGSSASSPRGLRAVAPSCGVEPGAGVWSGSPSDPRIIGLCQKVFWSEGDVLSPLLFVGGVGSSRTEPEEGPVVPNLRFGTTGSFLGFSTLLFRSDRSSPPEENARNSVEAVVRRGQI